MLSCLLVKKAYNIIRKDGGWEALYLKEITTYGKNNIDQFTESYAVIKTKLTPLELRSKFVA